MYYTKKQHYVPQFYLKYFCLTEDKLNIQFKNEDKIIKNQLVRNIACENDYFDISIDAPISSFLKEFLKEIDLENKTIKDYVHTNSMEKFFSELESIMGNIFSKFEKYVLNEKNIDTEFKYDDSFHIQKWIILFILIQYMRSPMYRDLYEKYYNGLCEICKNYAIKRNWINPNEKDYDNIIRNKDEAKVYHIRQIGELKNYDAMMNCICSMTCDILINKTEESFITSDSPVCALKRINDTHYVYSFFKKGECNMIIFPLSKQICLVFGTSPILFNNWYIKSCNDINKVKTINTLIFQSCKNQVYTTINKLQPLENIKLSFIELMVNIEEESFCIKYK